MNDSKTTLAELRQVVKQFVDDREWQPFHNPKNLSMALAIEAAELMEHFQWLTLDESRQLDSNRLNQVAEEMADVLCYCLALANSLDLDLSNTLERKMVKNRQKYPADEYRGRFGDSAPHSPTKP